MGRTNRNSILLSVDGGFGYPCFAKAILSLLGRGMSTAAGGSVLLTKKLIETGSKESSDNILQVPRGRLNDT